MGRFLPLGCVYIYYTMQYEISGSVLAGQITTTTWPVRVVDQGGSAQDLDLGGGSGGPGHGTP